MDRSTNKGPDLIKFTKGEGLARQERFQQSPESRSYTNIQKVEKRVKNSGANKTAKALIVIAVSGIIIITAINYAKISKHKEAINDILRKYPEIEQNLKTFKKNISQFNFSFPNKGLSSILAERLMAEALEKLYRDKGDQITEKDIKQLETFIKEKIDANSKYYLNISLTEDRFKELCDKYGY